MTRRPADEQTLGSLQEAENSVPHKEPCRRHKFSEICLNVRPHEFSGVNVTNVMATISKIIDKVLRQTDQIYPVIYSKHLQG